MGPVYRDLIVMGGRSVDVVGDIDRLPCPLVLILVRELRYIALNRAYMYYNIGI